MTLTFVGAEAYLPGEIADATVTVADGVIVEIGGPVQSSEISAHGKVLAPAIIDVHGDALERQLMPRPGIYFPIEVALIDTDRQLARGRERKGNLRSADRHGHYRQGHYGIRYDNAGFAGQKTFTEHKIIPKTGRNLFYAVTDKPWGCSVVGYGCDITTSWRFKYLQRHASKSALHSRTTRV